MDYDRRLQAYSSLRAEAWAGMGTVQALPLLHQSLADIRRTDDLAIRSSAGPPDHSRTAGQRTSGDAAR